MSIPKGPYQVHDLLSDSRYLWQGKRNFVELNPNSRAGPYFRYVGESARSGF